MSDTRVISALGEKYLRLHLCPEVGSIRFSNLLRELGGIDQALGASVATLQRVSQVGPKVAESIAANRHRVEVQKEIESASKLGVRIVCLDDEDYPALLRHIHDPPSVLYVRGTLHRDDGLALAIVGSRQCTRYGLEQAERFGALLANAGLTVISGMARGIDTHAHRGALAGGGRTIAVLGCGLSHLYPPESGELADKIVEHGAVISELPMDVGPDAKNFPPRNRIIAGLSLGVLVVEAAARSGALITARLASEYNREVFVIPGRIDSPLAQGTNDLIKRGGAKLVMGLEDILEELGEAGRCLMPDPSAAPNLPTTVVPSVRLNDDENAVLAAIAEEPLSIEVICDTLGLPPAKVAVALTDLQLKGAVQRSTGDIYSARNSSRA